MTTKAMSTKIGELEQRVRSLEEQIKSKPTTPGRSITRMWDERIQEIELGQEKRSRKILRETYGSISKERGQEMLKHIEAGRNAWK